MIRIHYIPNSDLPRWKRVAACGHRDWGIDNFRYGGKLQHCMARQPMDVTCPSCLESNPLLDLATTEI